ncbi:hypothetical protein BD309DRAFT_179375 [Dichomitus squalens]|nr:hypothetical protein BD309DRAFT_179375 [Dichomitus squalens]
MQMRVTSILNRWQSFWRAWPRSWPHGRLNTNTRQSGNEISCCAHRTTLRHCYRTLVRSRSSISRPVHSRTRISNGRRGFARQIRRGSGLTAAHAAIAVGLGLVFPDEATCRYSCSAYQCFPLDYGCEYLTNECPGSIWVGRYNECDDLVASPLSVCGDIITSAIAF